VWEFERGLVAGALMGGAVHTVVAPIERVKLLLQTQDGNAALLGRARRFRGFADCVARTVRDEGVLSLWRGNGTAVIRYYPSVALNFSLKVPSLPRPANTPPCRAFIYSLSRSCITSYYSIITPVISLRWYRGHCIRCKYY